MRERLQTPEEYRGYLAAAHEEGPETFALAVQDVLDFAATQMRDACVGAVREFDSWVWCKCSDCRADANSHAVDVHAGLNTLADLLQSLTLDQTEKR